jgi:hypothetical protein
VWDIFRGCKACLEDKGCHYTDSFLWKRVSWTAGVEHSKFQEVADFVYSNATMNLTTTMIYGIEFIISGLPLEHRTKCKLYLASWFQAFAVC